MDLNRGWLKSKNCFVLWYNRLFPVHDWGHDFSRRGNKSFRLAAYQLDGYKKKNHIHSCL